MPSETDVAPKTIYIICGLDEMDRKSLKGCKENGLCLRRLAIGFLGYPIDHNNIAGFYFGRRWGLQGSLTLSGWNKIPTKKLVHCTFCTFIPIKKNSGIPADGVA